MRDGLANEEQWKTNVTYKYKYMQHILHMSTNTPSVTTL